MGLLSLFFVSCINLSCHTINNFYDFILQPCDWIVKGRMRPNPLERNYEKRLLKITISGVVNLFNAVNQCKNKTGKSDSLVKKDFKLIDKNKFLGILLNGTATSSKEMSEHNDNEVSLDHFNVDLFFMLY